MATTFEVGIHANQGVFFFSDVSSITWWDDRCQVPPRSMSTLQWDSQRRLLLWKDAGGRMGNTKNSWSSQNNSWNPEVKVWFRCFSLSKWWFSGSSCSFSEDFRGVNWTSISCVQCCSMQEMRLCGHSKFSCRKPCGKMLDCKERLSKKVFLRSYNHM